ncbi:MAG: 6-hydroxymethylpterin diphosphokinase MptE-like protein [Bacillota bacterium]
MQFYKKNMEILKDSFQRVYNRIKKAEKNNKFELIEINEENTIAEIIDNENNFKIYIEKSRREGYTMKVDKDEQELYFHSKYAPAREAEKIVKDFGFSFKKQIFVLGTGLGYFLNQFNDENKYDKIIVIEPFLSIFYAALCFNDLSSFLKSKNIIMIIEDEENIFDLLRVYLNLSLEKEIDYLELSSEVSLFTEKFKNMYKIIKKSVNYIKISMATDIKYTRMWRENIIRNLNYIFKYPKVDNYFGAFESKPIICVSAGPSLDKNISKIKKAKNKALIMCVGTALKPLLNNEIRPDIVVSMDGHKKNYEHFKGIQLDSNTYLFSEMANNYLINDNWDLKQSFFTIKRNFSKWVENIKGEYTTIETGGSVAHSMIDIAYKMGGDPIILVGQDLAFTNGKTHADSTTFNKDVSEMNNLVKVRSVEGDMILTNKSFASMLTFLNNYINKRKSRTFIDATEGGAKIESTKVINLDDTIDLYCNNIINKNKILDSIFYNKKIEDTDRLIVEFKFKLKETIKELKESIKLVEDQLNAMNKVENILKNNDKLTDQELNKLEISFSKYENKLKQKKYLSYFVERTLIPERMRLNKIKSKYFINPQKSLSERMAAYYNFRKKFFEELKTGLKLLEELYLENEEIHLNKRKRIEV